MKQKSLRLPSARPRRFSPRFRPSPSGICVLCSGSGWRPVIENGQRRVTRCECRTDRKVEEMKVVNVLDRKSTAAGGDR